MKKKVQKLNRAKKEASKAEIKEKSEYKDQFDFGGIPERDLKKNLGCG